MRTVVHMMESVALPGGGGVKAAIKGYRIAIKTGTAKRSGRMVNTSTDISLIPRGGASKPASFCSGGGHQRPTGWEILRWCDFRAGVWCHHGGALRIMNVQPDALPTGDKSELVINNKEGSGGRS